MRGQINALSLKILDIKNVKTTYVNKILGQKSFKCNIWNAVPGLQQATTLGAAKSLAKKWAKDIPR